jgi:RNA polymerase sigma-70 factor (ECF subfamily)
VRPDREAACRRRRLRLVHLLPQRAGPESRTALTLRLVCGLDRRHRAHVPGARAAMAARITRAKKKVAAARIPYRVLDATTNFGASTAHSR